MATKELIEVFPLVRGDLAPHRYELRKSMVKKILSLENLKRGTIEEIQLII